MKQISYILLSIGALLVGITLAHINNDEMILYSIMIPIVLLQFCSICDKGNDGKIFHKKLSQTPNSTKTEDDAR